MQQIESRENRIICKNDLINCRNVILVNEYAPKLFNPKFQK